VNPRLTSRLWVDELLRRCQGEAKFGAVLHSGADEAGAVYVAVNHLNGNYDLLGPPAGSSHDEEGTRIFRKAIAQPALWDEVREFIARQRKFDSDIWVVEIEDRTGFAGLTVSPD